MSLVTKLGFSYIPCYKSERTLLFLLYFQEKAMLQKNNSLKKMRIFFIVFMTFHIILYSFFELHDIIGDNTLKKYKEANNMYKTKARAFTNKIRYTYKNNKLIYSIHQENSDKMIIRGKCYYKYDEDGRLILIKEILTDNKNKYKPTTHYKRYKYDQKNRLVYFNDYDDIYRFKYNKDSNIVCKEWGTEFEVFERTFHKYKDGREAFIKSSDGWTERKVYKNNKIISTRRNRDNKIIFKEIRKLDNEGNVIEIKNKYRTYQYKYDNLNNIIYIKEFDNKYLLD